MLAIGLILFVTFAGSFLLLRILVQLALRRSAPRAEVTIAGLISWLFVLSEGGLLVCMIFLLADFVMNGQLGSMLLLMFIGLALGVVLQFKEVLDFANVKDFVRTALFFRPYSPQPMLIEEELDKQKIRDVYQETSNKRFPTFHKEKPLLTEEEVSRLRQEMLALKDQPRVSRHLKEELQHLSAGRPVDLSDQWTIYTFDHALHDFYGQMSQLTIDPASRTLGFRLDVKDATERTLQDSVHIFRLKQDLYQLLQVLNTEPWLDPYRDYCDTLSVTCYGLESDSFGLVQRYPFLHLTIARKELSQREGVFFNAADLHTIATITFNNGKPLEQ